MRECKKNWRQMCQIRHFGRYHIMKSKQILSIFAILLVSAVFSAEGSGWRDDVLGDGYEMRYCEQDSDYSGAVRSSIVRKLPKEPAAKGVLYIHGFNDYFFQSDMGNRFVDEGYAFYAVDLRKYGRSLMPGQKPFEVRSLDEYFPDIDSAIVAMRQDGIREIVLDGHSTGGLIASYYLSRNPRPDIKALLLNSPFLDWNLGWKEHLVPAISLMGKFFPDMRIPQGDSEAYAESLLASDYGEWDFDTDWKFRRSPDVDAGWIRAIDKAQKALRDGKADIRVPVLLMYSDHSVYGDSWNKDFNSGDAVLDVEDIRRYGSRLGPDVTCVRVFGGLHDLVLSAPGVREPLYKYIFGWLAKKLPEEKRAE